MGLFCDLLASFRAAELHGIFRCYDRSGGVEKRDQVMGDDTAGAIIADGAEGEVFVRGIFVWHKGQKRDASGGWVAAYRSSSIRVAVSIRTVIHSEVYLAISIWIES